MTQSPGELNQAVEDFRRARQRAGIERVLSRLTGMPVDLLSYEDVRKRLQAAGTLAPQLREIPLDSIVGSVGRYSDFNRSFLPRKRSDQSRWAGVEVAVSSDSGLPPIEVFQLGEVYFVRDGHHRVSVARQMGADAIEAYVTRVRTRVPLAPDVRPDAIILKAGYTDLLAYSNLDRTRPGADFTVTAPGGYGMLKEHIAVHRYYMGIEGGGEISEEEAATDWHDRVYSPVVDLIRRRGVLRWFPERTETDLYLWISRHKSELEEGLGWEIRPEDAALDLAERHSPTLRRWLTRGAKALGSSLIPDDLEPGPRPGAWRRQRQLDHQHGSLFRDLLVPLDREPDRWNALDQAIIIARMEGSRILGLHVAADGDIGENEALQGLCADFDDRLEREGVRGNLVIEQGKPAPGIVDRARWSDLVIFDLKFPPRFRSIRRLGSGSRHLIQRSPRPLLAVRGKPTPMKRALLAFDGSLKSREALYVAAYLAGRHGVRLRVLTVGEPNKKRQRALEEARTYLEAQGVEAEYRLQTGPLASTILSEVSQSKTDHILMGGYGASPVLGIVLGSAVDQILRDSHVPMLIST